MPPSIALVSLYGLITALATSLGAVPFAFGRTVSARTVAFSNAAASGLMLGASFGLISEATSYGTWQTIVGGLLGVFFIFLGERLLQDREVHFGNFQGVGARRILLLVGTMTLHSFSEGLSVGVAFGAGEKLGVLIAVAIAIHNIPEGLAISAVMRPNGATLWACAGWSAFSSLPQPLMAVPAFLFVETFRPILPFGLGFAAGAMVFMVFLQLLPEAYERAQASTVGVLVSGTLGAMILLQRLLST